MKFGISVCMFCYEGFSPAGRISPQKQEALFHSVIYNLYNVHLCVGTARDCALLTPGD